MGTAGYRAGPIIGDGADYSFLDEKLEWAIRAIVGEALEKWISRQGKCMVFWLRGMATFHAESKTPLTDGTQ